MKVDIPQRGVRHRDRTIMLIVTGLSATVIALVLYLAGAFMRSTG